MASKKRSAGSDAFFSDTDPAGVQAGVVWEEGVIIGVDTRAYVYLIEADSGATIRDARRIAETPTSASLLPVGTRVMVCVGPPRGPYIWGVVCYPPDTDGVLLQQDAEDSRYLTAGDDVRMGQRQNLVAVRENGSCVMQSNAMAHIATYPDGHVSLHSNTFRHASAFGEFGIKQSGDAVSYYVRAGSSQQNHTGPLVDDAWVLRIDAGDEGNMLDVRVTTPQNQVLSQFYMGSDGAIRVLTEADRFSRVYGTDTTKVSGNYVVDVAGNSAHSVDGTHTDSYSSYVFKCAKGFSQSILGSRDVRVSGPDFLVVGGDQFHKTMGSSRHEITGGYERIITPVNGGPMPPQNAVWINTAGSYQFVTGFPGAFTVVTGATPNGVNLAVDGAAVYEPTTGKYLVTARPGGHHAVLGEPLVRWLKALMSWMDSHTHGTGVGPSTPPVIPSSISPDLLPMPVDLYFLSQRVTLGG